MKIIKVQRALRKQYNWIVSLASLCFFVTCILSSCNAMSANTDSNGVLGPNAAPVHFYYQGNMYVYQGKVVYSLSPECKLIGRINNIAGDFGVTISNEDFDGNANGNVYMNPEYNDVAYFQWSEWNEEVSGQEPYLICTLDKID